MTTDLPPALPHRPPHGPARGLAGAALLALLPLGACGSTPTKAGTPDPELEQQFAEAERDRADMVARQEAFKRILTDFDMQLDFYARALNDAGSAKAETKAQKLHSHLNYRVLRHYPQFLRAAEDRSIPRNRAIALAALGFSERDDALTPILNGLSSDDHVVVSNATFGLAILQNPRTPPTYLARVIEDEQYSDSTRYGAAWALYRIQQEVVDKSEIRAIWRRILDKPIENVLPSTAMTAIRGLGKIGNPEDNDLVLRYASHPVPKVRQATGIAIARLGVQSSYTTLLALIGPAEDNPNVRLAARKALQRLAGGDHDAHYDVDEWRNIFKRKED